MAVDLPPSALFWAVLGAFNVALGALMLAAKPRRRATLVAAGLVATNGLFGFVMAVRVVGIGRGYHEFEWIHWSYDVLLNLPVWAAFIVLPWMFPRRVLPARG